MCLLLLAHRVEPAYPVVVAANRDEYHARPAQRLHWWRDRPGFAGGRDGRAGGAWLAARSDGRFAAVLNDARIPAPPGAPSRGGLVAGFLEAADPGAFVAGLQGAAGRYAGFHLVAGQPGRAWYCARCGAPPRRLASGLHAVDNAGLDPGDARAARARALIEPALAAGADTAALLDALGDAEPPPRGTGDTRPVFITGAEFGTRCSTVLVLGVDGTARLAERRFGPGGRNTGETTLQWCWTAPAETGPA